MTTEIPINLPLPPPGPWLLFNILLVLSFIIHILFVGMMIGGTLWSVLFVVIGKSDPFYKRLAKETLDTVTINKSIAVVLGVAPLLIIGTIYTIYWYPVNQMTYPYFLSIIWLVIVAFLSLYIYRYTWYGLGERHPLVHLSFGVLGLAIFMVVPLIFLDNINLMLLPFRWESSRGPLHALLLPNVIQRYLHFAVAVCAIIGFFAAIYFWYRGRKSDDPFYNRAQRLGLKWALAATILQGAFGPINYVSLPFGAYSTRLLILVLVGLGLTAIVCIALIRAILETTGRNIMVSVGLVVILAILMSFIRDVVRINLLRGPNEVAARSTELYQSALSDFLKTYTPPAKTTEAQAVSGATGKELFEQHCSMCHAFDHVKVGPPETVMIETFKNQPDKMVAFVLNPTRINPNFPPMPKPPVTKEQVEKIVKYVLSQASQKAQAPPPTKTTQPPAPAAQPAAVITAGKQLFEQHCSMCHAFEHVKVGPPETYMIKKFKSEPDKMVAFVLNPTHINPNFPPMPKPPVTKEQVEKIVKYILSQSSQEKTPSQGGGSG